jgi:hypothetical protein
MEACGHWRAGCAERFTSGSEGGQRKRIRPPDPSPVAYPTFTKAAQEKNAENLLIIRDPALAAQYAQNWDAHRQHSQLYVGRRVR